MKKFLIAFIACMSVLAFTDTITLSQENLNYHYAYLTQHGWDEYPILHLVDPITNTATEFTIPFEWLVYNAVTSPDGEWVALLPEFDNNRQTAVVVFNIASQDIQTIPATTVLRRGDEEANLGKQVFIQWAPDSSKFAYSAYGPESDDVYIYDLINQTTINITDDDKSLETFQWSENNQFLVVISRGCEAGQCFGYIEIYDVQSGSIATSLLLSDDISYGSICNVALSPDILHVVYVSSCSTSYYGYPKEIYLGDFQAQTVIPLTNNTAIGIPILNAPDSSYVNRFGAYAPVWVNSDTLYVGSSVAIDQTPSRQGSVTRYELENQLSETDILNKTAIEWAYLPSVNKIAYLAFSDRSMPVDAQVQVSTILDGDFTNTTSYPPGCNLLWSPDARILAYTQHGELYEDCTRDMTGIYFVDTVQNTVNLVDIPNPSRTIPIGWVRVTGDNSPIRLK